MTRTLCCTIAGFALAIFGCSGSSTAPVGDVVSSDKLIGQWIVVKMGGKKFSEDDTLVFEFTKDGAMTSRGTKDPDDPDEGTFKVEGDKIVYTKKGFKDTGTMTIKKLNSEILILVDDGDKEREEMEMSKKK